MKLSRNEPCHCGSGKKYKKCCLADDEKAHREARAQREAEASEARPATQGPTAPSQSSDVSQFAPESPPKTEAEIHADQLWSRFIALDEPAPEELEEILSELAALPEEEEIPWSEVFSQCTAWRSCELGRVFRRISSSVPHTGKTGMAYFYWSAEEAFAKRPEEYGHLHDEVVEGFCRLDVDSYDYDALQPVLYSLLNVGCIDGALKLAETFLPVVRADGRIFSWVTARHCRELFELRIGNAIRHHRPDSVETADQSAAALLADIEEEIHADVALAAAKVIIDDEDDDGFDWTHSAFTLVRGEKNENDPSGDAGVALFATLVRVARENWQTDGQPPGKTVLALSFLLESAYQSEPETGKRGKKGKKNETPDNLLDCLRPSGMEKRIALSSAGAFGPDPEKVRLLLHAHEALNRTARRRGLLSTEEADKSERQIRMLKEKVS